MAVKTLNPTDTEAETQTGGALAPGLYLVATPIGHSRDISLRALDVLRGAGLILAEDTRNTRKLLHIHGIGNSLQAFHDHNETAASERVLGRLKAGDRIALVSDAGTPLISDPGYRLVRAALENGVPVTHVPGASSVLAALVLSGLPPDKFFFGGFLPVKSGARRRAIEAAKAIPATLLFLEGRSRLAEALGDLADILGPRPAALARELTKLHEEVLRGPLDELARIVAARDPVLGEMVIVIGGPEPRAEDADALDKALAAALAGSTLSQAASDVANALGLPRGRVYRRALELASSQDRQEP